RSVMEMDIFHQQVAGHDVGRPPVGARQHGGVIADAHGGGAGRRQDAAQIIDEAELAGHGGGGIPSGPPGQALPDGGGQPGGGPFHILGQGDGGNDGHPVGPGGHDVGGVLLVDPADAYHGQVGGGLDGAQVVQARGRAG